MKEERKSNFELLRIISMVLIICHHYVEHGAFGNLTLFPLNFNKFFLQVLHYGGKLGVNLFVLISGYFLISSSFKMKKGLKLWLQVSFYSIVIMLIFLIVYNNLSVKIIIKSILPIVYNEYWFATTYFVLYILSGYINKFIKSLCKIDLERLILLLIVICSIIPTIFSVRMINSSLIWFILLYLIGAYIRLYSFSNLSCKKSLIYGISIYAFCLLFCLGMDIIGNYNTTIGSYSNYFMGMDKLPMLLVAVFIFNGFRLMNIKNSNFINSISASTFAVYLIHDNNLVRPWLWQTLLKNNLFINSKLLFLHAITSVILVFVICTIIDFLYRKFIEKRLFDIILNILKKLKDTVIYKKIIKEKINLF